MHVMVIEASRRIWGDNCNSTEFVPDTSNPVVTIIRNDQQLGGTMKLGSHFLQLLLCIKIINNIHWPIKYIKKKK